MGGVRPTPPVRQALPTCPGATWNSASPKSASHARWNRTGPPSSSSRTGSPLRLGSFQRSYIRIGGPSFREWICRGCHQHDPGDLWHLRSQEMRRGPAGGSGLRGGGRLPGVRRRAEDRQGQETGVSSPSQPSTRRPGTSATRPPHGGGSQRAPARAARGPGPAGCTPGTRRRPWPAAPPARRSWRAPTLSNAGRRRLRYCQAGDVPISFPISFHTMATWPAFGPRRCACGVYLARSLQEAPPVALVSSFGESLALDTSISFQLRGWCVSVHRSAVPPWLPG